MRIAFAFLLLIPSFASAQTKEMLEAVEKKLETLRFIASLETPGGGFAAAPQDPNIDAIPQPSLRATSAAVRAWKYIGGEKLPNKEKHAAFVLKCFDPNTGGFAEPSGKPDVTITSIGVMAAMEFGIPKEKFAKAMDYLKANAKTFEEVRIAAAAVEAWGVKDCPFKLDEWFKIASLEMAKEELDAKDGGARTAGSVGALVVRLGLILSPKELDLVVPVLHKGQLADGGWNKKGEKASDIETTYRVMRAFMLLHEKPKDVAAVRKFIASHRNKDGGSATKPGEKSSMGGTYYAAIITKWLDEMEKQ